MRRLAKPYSLFWIINNNNEIHQRLRGKQRREQLRQGHRGIGTSQDPQRKKPAAPEGSTRPSPSCWKGRRGRRAPQTEVRQTAADRKRDGLFRRAEPPPPGLSLAWGGRVCALHRVSAPPRRPMAEGSAAVSRLPKRLVGWQKPSRRLAIYAARFRLLLPVPLAPAPPLATPRAAGRGEGGRGGGRRRRLSSA